MVVARVAPGDGRLARGQRAEGRMAGRPPVLGVVGPLRFAAADVAARRASPERTVDAARFTAVAAGRGGRADRHMGTILTLHGFLLRRSHSSSVQASRPPSTESA